MRSLGRVIFTIAAHSQPPRRWCFGSSREGAAAVPPHRLAVLWRCSASLTASSCSTAVLCISRRRGLLHRRSTSRVIDLVAYFHPLLSARQRVPLAGSPSTQPQVPPSGHSHLPSIRRLHSWRCAAYLKESQEGEHANVTPAGISWHRATVHHHPGHQFKAKH